MKKFNLVLQCILNLIVGFISVPYVIVGWLGMLNAAKPNNYEGEGQLQVLGFLMLLAWLILIILFNYLFGKKVVKQDKKFITFICLIFIPIGFSIRLII